MESLKIIGKKFGPSSLPTPMESLIIFIKCYLKKYKKSSKNLNKESLNINSKICLCLTYQNQNLKDIRLRK